MSSSVTVKSLSQISSNIVTWINAADVNQAIGSSVTSLTGREGKDSSGSIIGTYTLQYDSDGYKCIRTTDSSPYVQLTYNALYNNNETFVFVVNVKGVSGISAQGLTDGNYMTIASSGFSYANFTIGSSRVTFTNVLNKKRILTAIMTPSAMYVYDGYALIATLLNPATLASYTSAGRAFVLYNNFSGVEVDFYSIVRIQQALSGERLRQAIRSVAFENGVKI